MSDQQEMYLGRRIGKYRLVRKLGGGGFGTVYLAEHRHEHTRVAVKVLHISLMKPGDFKDFLNEARTAELRHPHIMPVLDFGIGRRGPPFLVMEYAPGGTIQERHPRGERVALSTIVSYVDQIASALQYAHDQRVIHRDVKPQNILIRADGTLLVSDFGVAKFLEQSVLTSQQTQVGTPAYMAPEQLRGYPCFASDQYALAVVIYEWICGVRPFEGTALGLAVQHMNTPPPLLRDLLPELSEVVERVVIKALAKAPEDRFECIERFADALHEAIQPSPNTAVLGSPIEAGDKTPLVSPMSQSPATLLSPQALPQLTQLDPTLPKSHVLHRGLSKIGRIIALVLLLLVGTTGLLFGRNIGSTSSTPVTPSVSPPVPYTPMFGFNAQHTRYNPDETSISATNVSHLALDWTGSVGSTTSSSPAISNNIIYIGSDDGKLYAFNAGGCGRPSCTPLWAVPTHGTVGSSPAIANNVVYVGSDDHSLYAFDASSGQILWTGSTNGGITSSPVVANGTVYVGSFDHNLYAFDAAGCGKGVCAPLWIAPTGSDVVSSPAFVNNVIYVGSSDGKLYAFNAFGCGSGSCSPLWTTVAASNSINSSPTVVNGVVYVGSDDYKLYAFNATGCGKAICSPLWTSIPTGDSIFSSPAVANGVVYIGSRDGKLRAFNAAGCRSLSCAPLWVASTGSSIFTSPSVANGVVYIGSDDYKLYAFSAAGCGNASTCAPLWTSPPTGDRIYSSTALINNGVVYVGSFDGNLYAFHLLGTTP